MEFVFRDTTLLSMLGDVRPFYTILLHKKQSERAHVKNNFIVVMVHHTPV